MQNFIRESRRESRHDLADIEDHGGQKIAEISPKTRPDLERDKQVLYELIVKFVNEKLVDLVMNSGQPEKVFGNKKDKKYNLTGYSKMLRVTACWDRE